jgi:hypothetical protein
MPRNLTKCWWRGFTLVETLVVFAMLAVLVAMLLPVLQKAHEAATRAQSMSNLRQLTIALQDFGDQHDGTLPPGGGSFPDYRPGRTWVYASSLYYFMIPYIESNPLFLHGDWSYYSGQPLGFGYPDGSNNGKGTPTYWAYIAGMQKGTMFKIFQAPGDPTQQPGGGWNGSDGMSYPHNGLAFPSWQTTKFPTSFSDGTSQTIFFTEAYSVTNGGAYWRSWWRYTHHDQWNDHSADYWAPNYVANPTYNPPFQTMPNPKHAQWYLPQGLSSEGIAVGMGDGSARIVNRDVSPSIWYAANTPNSADGSDFEW